MEEDKFKEGFLDLKINNYIDGFRNKYRNEYQCLKELDSFFYRIQDVQRYGPFVYFLVLIFYKLYIPEGQISI